MPVLHLSTNETTLVFMSKLAHFRERLVEETGVGRFDTVVGLGAITASLAIFSYTSWGVDRPSFGPESDNKTSPGNCFNEDTFSGSARSASQIATSSRYREVIQDGFLIGMSEGCDGRRTITFGYCTHTQYFQTSEEHNGPYDPQPERYYVYDNPEVCADGKLTPEDLDRPVPTTALGSALVMQEGLFQIVDDRIDDTA